MSATIRSCFSVLLLLAVGCDSTSVPVPTSSKNRTQLASDHTPPNDAVNSALAALKQSGTRIGIVEGRALTVDFSAEDISNSDLKPLRQLPEIVALKLNHTPITDEGLIHLAPLSKLQSLNIANTGVTDAGISHLAGLTNLLSLDLSNTKVSDAGLQQLAEFKLTRLYLSNTHITDAGLQHLKQLTTLRLLEIEENLVSADGVRRLQAALPDCEIQTELYDPPGTTEKEAITRINKRGGSVERMENKMLSISFVGSKEADAGLAQFKVLTAAQWLNLSQSNASDEGLSHLRTKVNLRTLNLSHTDVTDIGLKHLKDLINLSNLDVSHTNVTDAGLVPLHQLRNLQYLKLSGTKVTDAGVLALQSKLENCVIERVEE